jgi:hypothetical protein
VKQLKNNKMKTLSINEQKQILRLFALDLLKNGHDFEVVNDALKAVVIDRNYSTDINVDAIRYLAKDELGLHDYQKNK